MEEEEEEVVSCSSDSGDDDVEVEQRKSQNVEALLRYWTDWVPFFLRSNIY